MCAIQWFILFESNLENRVCSELFYTNKIFSSAYSTNKQFLFDSTKLFPLFSSVRELTKTYRRKRHISRKLRNFLVPPLRIPHAETVMKSEKLHRYIGNDQRTLRTVLWKWIREEDGVKNASTSSYSSFTGVSQPTPIESKSSVYRHCRFYREVILRSMGILGPFYVSFIRV